MTNTSPFPNSRFHSAQRAAKIWPFRADGSSEMVAAVCLGVLDQILHLGSSNSLDRYRGVMLWTSLLTCVQREYPTQST